MARPKKDINPKQVEKLARYGATNVEIADIFGVNEGTIRKRFSEELTKGRSDRRVKLRRKQYELALRGNVTMLIWLGKQDLGQAEKVENKTEVSGRLELSDDRRRAVQALAARRLGVETPN